MSFDPPLGEEVKETYRGLKDLTVRLIRIFENRGWFCAATEIKRLGKLAQSEALLKYSGRPGKESTVRSWSFTGKYRNPTANQWWFLGSTPRGLPPDERKGSQEAAILQHFDDYTSSPKIANHDCVDIKDFVMKLIKRTGTSYRVGPKQSDDDFEGQLEKAFRNTDTDYEAVDSFRDGLPSIPLNDSGTLEKPRSKGGLIEAVRRIVSHFINPDGTTSNEKENNKTEFGELPVVSPESFKTGVLLVSEFEKSKRLLNKSTGQDTQTDYQLQLVRYHLLRFYNPDPLPAKVHVITDPISARGLKQRVVTTHSVIEYLFGKPHNMVMQDMFKKIEQVAPTVLGFDVADTFNSNVLSDEQLSPHPLRTNQKFEGEKLTSLSADLTRASDLIPLEVAKAVMSGYAEALELKEREANAIYASIGPRRLVYPAPVSKTIETSRGVLMGCPFAWPILTILNLYAGCVASGTWYKGRLSSVRTRIPLSTFKSPKSIFSVSSKSDKSIKELKLVSLACQTHVDKSNRRWNWFTVNGDDFAAVWTTERTREYYSCIERCGLELQREKQHEIDQEVSDVEGYPTQIVRSAFIFSEEMVVWKSAWTGNQNDNVKRFTGYTVNRIPVSAIVYAKAYTASGRLSNPDTAVEVTLADAMKSIGRLTDGWRQRTEDTLLRVHSKSIDRLVRNGIEPFWPRPLGGAGIKPSTGWRATRKTRKIAATLLTLENEKRKKLLNRAQRIWKTTTVAEVQRITQDITEEFLANMELVQDEEYDLEDTIPLELAKSALTAHVAGLTARNIMLIRKPKARAWSANKASVHIKKLLSKFQSAWASVHPISNSKLDSLLSSTGEQKVQRKRFLEEVQVATFLPTNKTTFSLPSD
jgi:hypothetical protein